MKFGEFYFFYYVYLRLKRSKLTFFFNPSRCMKKVILLVVSMPVMAYGQISETIKSGTSDNRVLAELGDIVITEIMADPLPAVSLPAEEYIEIFNRTGYTFDLENWNLLSEDQSGIFPSTEINPGEYLIVCSYSDTSFFSQFGRVVGLNQFPTLINDGMIIVISDSSGNLISGIEYSSSWYGNSLKESGGWSLEMVDTDYPFCYEGNWEAASSRKGGTPGSVNSSSRSNPDNIFLGVRNLLLTDSATITLMFDEPVFNLPANSGEIMLDRNRIIEVSPSDPLFRRFTLTTEKALIRREVYTLYIPDVVTDFAGNKASGTGLRFGIPEPAEKGNVVFNELLFNPLPDDPDYIELYNLSEKIIDASELFLASVDDETGKTSTAKQVSGEQRLILPGSFYAVTSDRAKVTSRYSASVQDNIFNAASLPSMPDERGHLLLLNRQTDVIDEVLYSEKMHYSLLKGNEGISLEKIRPDLPSDESMNWHSASESVGWGTPGAENSVCTDELSGSDEVIFSSAKISPDNDGFEDVLVIDLNTEGIGNAVSASVFDETGSYVRKIAENYFAGSQATLIWDGSADDGSIVNTGIYIVLIELYNDKGKTERWKKVCAVIRR